MGFKVSLLVFCLITTTAYATILSRAPEGGWVRSYETVTRQDLVAERKKINEDIDAAIAAKEEQVAILRAKKAAVQAEIDQIDTWVDQVIY